jgi:hypothetical protein
VQEEAAVKVTTSRRWRPPEGEDPVVARKKRKKEMEAGRKRIREKDDRKRGPRNRTDNRRHSSKRKDI